MRWVVVAFCLASTAAQAADGVLEVALEPVEITVGERVAAELTLEWTGPEPAAAPRFPAWGETWGDAEVLSAGEVAAAGGGGRRIYRQELVLTAFRAGPVELPPVTIAVPLAGDTVTVTQRSGAGFEVRSVLPEGSDDLEARPPAPLVGLEPAAGFPWLAAALAAAALAAAAWLARRLGRRRRAGMPARRLEPLQELLLHLRRLDPGAGEPAHTGLSLGMRGFLGRSLHFRALEGTTSEIQRRLRRARIGPVAAERTVRLLRDCDLVKFARVETLEKETAARLHEAVELAEEIDAALRPEPAEAVT